MKVKNNITPKQHSHNFYHDKNNETAPKFCKEVLNFKAKSGIQTKRRKETSPQLARRSSRNAALQSKYGSTPDQGPSSNTRANSSTQKKKGQSTKPTTKSNLTEIIEEEAG